MSAALSDWHTEVQSHDLEPRLSAHTTAALLVKLPPGFLQVRQGWGVHPRSNPGAHNHPTSRPSSASASRISHTPVLVNRTQVTSPTSSVCSILLSPSPPLPPLPPWSLLGVWLLSTFAASSFPIPLQLSKGMGSPSFHSFLKPTPLSRPIGGPCVAATILPGEWPSPTTSKIWMQTAG